MAPPTFFNAIRPQLVRALPRQSLLIVSRASVVSPSMKRLLVNIRGWQENSDIVSYLCTCDISEKMCGTVRASGCGHVVSRLQHTRLWQLFPADTNANTKCIPILEWLVRKFGQSIRPFQRKFNLIVDVSQLEILLATHVQSDVWKRQKGIGTRAMEALRKFCSNRCFILFVDKESESLCV